MSTILFYTSTFRNFRNVLLGHLIELQKNKDIQIVLLIENFDSRFIELLNSKALFPNIILIQHINQYSPQSKYSLREYKKFKKILNTLFDKYNFKIVIGTSDFHSIFELLLFRYCRKHKSFGITISSTIAGKMDEVSKWIDLVNRYNYQKLLPSFIIDVFLFVRKYFGHFYFYYFLPLAYFDLPFFGKSSFLLNKGQSGMRDTNLHIVFSQREKTIFVANGVATDKILVLPPDFENQFREFNQKYLFQSGVPAHDFLVLLPALEIGFNKKDLTLISPDSRMEMRIKIIGLISNLFPRSQIIIKPHPVIEDNYEFIQRFIKSFGNVSIAKSGVHIDEYINNAQVVIDLPMSQSSTLYLGKLQFPEKTFVSLNLQREFEGDYYLNNSHDILYFDEFSSFKVWVQTLKLDIRSAYIPSRPITQKKSLIDILKGLNLIS